MQFLFGSTRAIRIDGAIINQVHETTKMNMELETDWKHMILSLCRVGTGLDQLLHSDPPDLRCLIAPLLETTLSCLLITLVVLFTR